jgi:hypothetical protein
MTRPSSEKSDVNWDGQAHAGEQAPADEPWDDDDSEARASSPANIAPLVWGAAAFAGAVAVGLVLRSRRRSRWRSLLTINITPAAGPVPARRALWSTIGSAAARFAFQKLMAQSRALAEVETAGDAAWAKEARPAARSSAGLENGRPGS